MCGQPFDRLLVLVAAGGTRLPLRMPPAAV
jgi:hypothetical protein